MMYGNEIHVGVTLFFFSFYSIFFFFWFNLIKNTLVTKSVTPTALQISSSCSRPLVWIRTTRQLLGFFKFKQKGIHITT